MPPSATRLSPLIAAGILLAGTACFGAGGTSSAAQKGQPAYIAEGLPEGTAALVNDSHRTNGWNDWFTEWCNDVNHYAYEVTSAEEINKLIEKLAAIKSDVKEVRLSYLKEPQGLGWVTHLPAGNKTPVLLSIGDQTQVDQWFSCVRKPFGQIEFTGTPIAVPPTLTIFVQNELVDLDKLSIPKGVQVLAGYVPLHFHRWNTVQEKERESKPPEVKKPELDAQSRAAVDKIDAFLKKREKAE
jgi:hypothetical protein